MAEKVVIKYTKPSMEAEHAARVYNNLLTSGSLDQTTGSLMYNLPSLLKLDWNEDNEYMMDEIDLAVATGLVDLYDNDDFTHRLVMPKHKAKQFDPYYRQYKEELDKLQYFIDYDDGGEITDGLIKHFTLRGLLNLNKSPNKERVLSKLRDFVNDFPAYEGKFDSINEFEAAPAKIAEENELRDYRQRAMKELGLNPEYYNYEIGKRNDEINALVEKYKQEEHKPFNIAEETRKIAAKHGWRVLSSTEDMKETGQKLRHCYGDLKTYGTSHHKEYARRCRNIETLLLTNGEVTAELIIDYDPEGSGKSQISIGQVNGYDNERNNSADVAKSLNDIVDELYGKTKEQISDKRTKRLIGILARRF